MSLQVPPYFATAVDAILKNWTALQVILPKMRFSWIKSINNGEVVFHC
jgi:hypothetical protein